MGKGEKGRGGEAVVVCGFDLEWAEGGAVWRWWWWW